MGLSGQIKCPTCSFSTFQRLGVGEEFLWPVYSDYAQRELAGECPDHPKGGSWKFLDTPAWRRVEAAYYGSGARSTPDITGIG
jgi:hypothetical protein